METITSKSATNNGTKVLSTFFGDNNNEQKPVNIEPVTSEKPIETTVIPTNETAKDEVKTETKVEAKTEPKKKETQPKKQAAKSKKVAVPVEKEVKPKEKAAKPAKAPKLAAKDKNINDYTLADARTRMREATKESKSLSGTLKIILSFWDEGYKDAFAAIGLLHKDITVPTIQKLWHNDLKVNNVFAYKTKVAGFKKSITGETLYEYDRDGNKVFDTVLKEFNNNFSPIRIFDAMYYAQFAKGKTIFQVNEKKAEKKTEAKTETKADIKADKKTEKKTNNKTEKKAA